MKSTTDYCNIIKIKCNDEYEIFNHTIHHGKTVIHWFSGSYQCMIQSKTVFYTDCCEVSFEWLTSKCVDYESFINELITKV